MAVKKKESLKDKMTKKGQSYQRVSKTIGRRKSAGGSGG